MMLLLLVAGDSRASKFHGLAQLGLDMCKSGALISVERRIARNTGIPKHPMISLSNGFTFHPGETLKQLTGSLGRVFLQRMNEC